MLDKELFSIFIYIEANIFYLQSLFKTKRSSFQSPRISEFERADNQSVLVGARLQGKVVLLMTSSLGQITGRRGTEEENRQLCCSSVIFTELLIR